MKRKTVSSTSDGSNASLPSLCVSPSLSLCLSLSLVCLSLSLVGLPLSLSSFFFCYFTIQSAFSLLIKKLYKVVQDVSVCCWLQTGCVGGGGCCEEVNLIAVNR